MNLHFHLGHKHKPLSLWQRFSAVWQAHFLSQLDRDPGMGKAWKFWFLHTTLFTILATLVLGTVFSIGWQGARRDLVQQVPSEAAVVLSEGTLSTENIPEPIFWEDPKQEFLLAIDTQGTLTLPENPVQETVVLIGPQMAQVSENYGAKIQDFSWAEVEDFRLTGAEVKQWLADNGWKIETVVWIALFVLFWIWLAAVRLISALFWALLAWMAGTLLGIKGWTFEKSFRAMLHYLMLTMIFWVLLETGGINFWGSTAVLLFLLFGMNFWHLKKV